MKDCSDNILFDREFSRYMMVLGYPLSHLYKHGIPINVIYSFYRQALSYPVGSVERNNCDEHVRLVCRTGRY